MNEQVCPACGKPTGGYVPCPHCGADPKNRLGMRAVILVCAVVLAAGIGYFFLHMATIQANPTPIASIDTWLNYASVWIEGTVISGPQAYTSSVYFDVQDDSGESIEVKAYFDPQTLKSQGKFPMVGDHVKVFGMLRVFLDGSLELRVSELGTDQFTGEERFQVTPAQAVSTTINDLTSTWSGSQSLKYKRVTLEGKVAGMRPIYSANTYTLEDNAGRSVDLYVHNGLIYVENEELDFKLLQTIRVTAGASEYSGSPQLALANYDDITVIDNESPATVAIDNISENDRDEFIKTEGKIVFLELEGGWNSLEVYKRRFWLENTDNPAIWMWESSYKLLPDNIKELLKRGSVVELTGKVSETGTLSVELVGPPEISLTAGTYEPTFVENVAEIGSDNKDDLVTIQGELIDSENIGTAVVVPYDRKFTLQDNFGGTIKVWISNTVYERMLDPPSEGDTVRILGKIVESYGEIQVRPGVPGDVVKVS